MRSMSVLVALALSLGSPVLAQEGPAAPAAEPSPDQRVAAALARKVTFNLDQTPMSEFGDLMSDLLRVDVVVAPECADTKLSMCLRDVTAKAAFSLAAASADLECSFRGGVIYLHPAGEGLGPIPLLGADVPALRVSLCFDQTPLSEAVLFLQDITGLNVVVAAAKAGDRTVTLRVRDLPLAHVLALIARQAGLAVRVEDGVIVFDRSR